MSRRAHGWAIDLQVAIAERAERHDWGIACLSPGIDRVWDANWLLVEGGSLGAEEVAALADEVLGGAGMSHRTVGFRDPERGAALAPGFEALGWSAQEIVYMGWEGGEADLRGVAVEEVAQEGVLELRRQLIRGDLSRVGKEMGVKVVEQLLEYDRRLGAVAGDRWFAARSRAGELASCCRLLARDGVGQVEDVGTLRRAREQGLGRAVTLAAAAASRGAGDELTFLAAEADDWPQAMYGGLGFEPIGSAWGFRRTPPT